MFKTLETKSKEFEVLETKVFTSPDFLIYHLEREKLNITNVYSKTFFIKKSLYCFAAASIKNILGNIHRERNKLLKSFFSSKCWLHHSFLYFIVLSFSFYLYYIFL